MALMRFCTRQQSVAEPQPTAYVVRLLAYGEFLPLTSRELVSTNTKQFAAVCVAVCVVIACFFFFAML